MSSGTWEDWWSIDVILEVSFASFLIHFDSIFRRFSFSSKRAWIWVSRVSDFSALRSRSVTKFRSLVTLVEKFGFFLVLEVTTLASKSRFSMNGPILES